MDAHHEALAASTGLLTTARAEQLGYSRAELVRLRGSGELSGLRKGIYRVGDAPGLTTLGEIRQTAVDCVGWPYSRRVGRVVAVVAVVDDTTESVHRAASRAVEARSERVRRHWTE